MASIILKTQANAHKCYAEKEGDWIVFRCLVCEDFEKRMNTKTGKWESTISPDNQIPHHGFFIPPGLDADLYNPN